jgi:cysteinyl-tRNA synthetase
VQVIREVDGRKGRLIGGPPEPIEQLAWDRDRARREHAFERADELRAQLRGAGWLVEDMADGFRLQPAKP